MSERTSGSLSIDTYMSKQEGLLLEHIRRMLQAETKITLLESALQDMYKRNEELSQQVESTQDALQQAVNGITAVTNERDSLKANLTILESDLTTARADLNRALIQKTEIDKLNERLKTLQTDYDTLKQNYNSVLKSHDSLTSTHPEVLKKKKIKSTESEWTDGQY